jgi:hypothetical protein
MVGMAKLLSVDEIQKLLKDLPRDVRLDLVQFALDLMGLVNPAADAASAAISLWRGDFFGAAISAVSIIPIGDVLKIAKLGKYAKTFETLVTKVVPNKPELYKELTPAMEQFRAMLAKIPAGNANVERLRELVSKFFKNAELHRLSSGVRGLEGWAQFAKQRGRWKKPAYAKHGTTPSGVVDELVNLAQNGGHASQRLNAKKLVEEMGQKDWLLVAGPHRTTPDRVLADRTPHITVEIPGQPYDYHLRLDAKGHVWEIRTLVKEGKQAVTTNPVAGTGRPWQGPGQ